MSIENIFKVLEDLKLLKGDEETGNLKRSERILEMNQASKDTIKRIVGHDVDRGKKLKFEVEFYDYIHYDKNEKAEDKPRKQPNRKLTYEQLVQLREGKKIANEYIKKHTT